MLDISDPGATLLEVFSPFFPYLVQIFIWLLSEHPDAEMIHTCKVSINNSLE